VVALNDLRTARKTGPEAVRAGLVIPARHRDGSQVAVEVSGRPRPEETGEDSGFEGIGRPVDRSAAGSLAADEVRAREVRARAEGVLTDGPW
jgi:hypothetical protein